VQGIAELLTWVRRDDWPLILDNYARCVRITRPEPETYPVDPERFEADIERELYDATCAAEQRMDAQGNVDDFLAAFAPVVPVIQRYFEGVMVHAPDQAVRRNRLGLLQAVAGLARGRADLSELAGF